MYLEIFQAHARLLKALAHPRRLEIVHLLRESELAVNQIHWMLDLPQANISQHLSILREAGLVSDRKQGKQVFYSLSDPRIIQVSDQVRELVIDNLGREDGQDDSFEDQFKLPLHQLLPLTHDPVCGMRLSPKTASFSTKYKSQQIYFCASGCLKLFNQEPEKYVKNL